jgi:hypothetical protein
MAKRVFKKIGFLMQNITNLETDQILIFLEVEYWKLLKITFFISLNTFLKVAKLYVLG